LGDELEQFMAEYQQLMMTLDDDSNFKFHAQCQEKGKVRHVLWENGTKVNDETYCQCFDLTFGSTCSGTKVNCQDDSKRRTSAGHNAPRQYFIECTGNKPNVIRCVDGKIYDKERKACVSHSLKKHYELF